MPPRDYVVPPESRCKAATHAGNRCKRPRQDPRDFCQNHPDGTQIHPDAMEAQGGNGNGDKIKIPHNPTAADIARISSQAAVLTMEGRMTPQQGATVSKLMETALKASEKAVPDDGPPPGGATAAAPPDPYAGAPATEEA